MSFQQRCGRVSANCYTLTLLFYFFLQLPRLATLKQGIGIVGKCLGPTTSKGPTKDSCKIFEIYVSQSIGLLLMFLSVCKRLLGWINYDNYVYITQPDAKRYLIATFRSPTANFIRHIIGTHVTLTIKRPYFGHVVIVNVM